MDTSRNKQRVEYQVCVVWFLDLKMADAENIHSAVNDADLLLEANNGECNDALSDLSTITCTNPPPAHSNSHPYDLTGRPSLVGEILSKLAIIDKNLKKLSKINEIDA